MGRQHAAIDAAVFRLRVVRNDHGAFDIASIIVGVVLLGILVLGIVLGLQGLIPWAQDHAAKQDLAAVRTAESATSGKDGVYLNKADLINNQLMSDSASVAVATDTPGSCYIAIAKSGSGKVFWVTDKTTLPKEDPSTASPSCVSSTEVADLVDGIGGPAPVAGGSPGDLDGDGIPDASDPDRDGDGIPNGSDPTPDGGTAPAPSGPTLTALPASIDTDQDGVHNGFDPSPSGESDFRIAGFGGNWSGELGTLTAPSTLSGLVMEGDIAGERIAVMSKNVGAYHACATLMKDGALWCWGDNSSGQLGNGTKGGSSLPVKVTGLDGKAVSMVVAMGYNTCAIADGEPYCWGDWPLTNAADSVLTATRVDTGGVLAGKTITRLVGGNQFACVLADGLPHCWGKGAEGQLGSASTGSPTPIPVDVSGVLAGKTVTDLGAHNSGACAIADGVAACWGKGNSGQLGNGTRSNSSVPVAVSGLPSPVTSISGAYENVCAVAAGDAFCWGSKTGRMLGDGVAYSYDFSVPDNNYQTTPKAVLDTTYGGAPVSQVELGDMHGCLVAAAGLHCWGEVDNTDVYTWAPERVDNGDVTGKTVIGLFSIGGSVLVTYLT